MDICIMDTCITLWIHASYIHASWIHAPWINVSWVHTSWIHVSWMAPKSWRVPKLPVLNISPIVRHRYSYFIEFCVIHMFAKIV